MVITKHALEQYKKRIANNPYLSNTAASKTIEALFGGAKYISDNSSGILFRNESMNVEFIIKRGKMVTLFPINPKAKEERGKNAIINKYAG
ncbi:hypothetical protein [Ignavibacterium sp.]|uniref:hypothetical protein n=1 Tax=Ignavibacterium sp. TaxID=2651167 RepID=UPI00307CD3C0